MKIFFCIFLSILADETSIKELEDDIKGKLALCGRTLSDHWASSSGKTCSSEYGMLEMSDIEVTKVLESDATEWQKKLFNLYNPYPLKISFQNQLIQIYGIGARDRFDQLVKEGKGMVT